MPKGTYYFHFHGTTNLCNSKPEWMKSLSATSHPDLFTKGTGTAFIPLSQAPSGVRNFSSIYNLADENRRYYGEWSGNISDQEREKAANDFTKLFKNIILKDLNIHLEKKNKKEFHEDDIIDIIMVGHSHGATIAVKIARHFNSQQNQLRFHIISVAMPIYNSPSGLPTSNVKIFQHFYDKKDIKAKVGSILMQGIFNSVTHRIEDVYQNYNLKKPNGYVSHDLQLAFSCMFWNIHEDSMRSPASNYICEIFLKAYKAISPQPSGRNNRF